MKDGPAILVVESNASDRDLVRLLLQRECPRTPIVAAADPLAFARAVQDAPAVAVVAADLTWAGAADVIGHIKRRSPLTGIVLFGSEAGIAAHALNPGLALDGIAGKSSAGYLALASLVADVFARRERRRYDHARARRTHDRMIGSLEVSASDVVLLPRDSPPGSPLVMESSPMSDVPRSFDMQAPESRPVPVDTLKPAMRDDPPAPVREGLPPTFRMRADAHYVESLDMVPPGPKLQLVDVSRIDPRDASRAQPAPALVESIQSVGVLQPLIAEPRNGRFRLLAGVRRLAAARAAGLRDVPCIVRRADEDGAAEVTAAANLFVAGETAARAVAEPDAAGTDATRELARVLSSLSRCLPLLEQPASDLARAAALNLLKAEVLRATWLAEAAAVLRGESSMTRRRIPVERLVSRVLQAVEPERSLRGVVLERQATASHGDVAGDEERLVCALSGAVMATMELVEGSAAPVSVIARTDPEDSFVFSVAQSSAGAPPAWGTRVSDAPTIAGAGGIGAVALAAARRIVEACGGSLTVESVEFGSEIQVVLPRVS